MMIMPIFPRLLVTRMVASSFSGISSSRVTTILVFDLEVLKELTSEGDKEKNAASAPDTRADKANRMIMAISAINKFRVNGLTEKSGTELII